MCELLYKCARDLVEAAAHGSPSDASAVNPDELTVLFVNIKTVVPLQIENQWSTEAAPSSGRAIVELLRREAGALALRRSSTLDAQQLTADAALVVRRRNDDDGSLVVTVPASTLRRPNSPGSAPRRPRIRSNCASIP